MNTVLMIVPPAEGLVGKSQHKFHRAFPPLSCLITASLLRQHGWQVQLLDLNANRSISVQTLKQQAETADVLLYTTNPYADWQCPSFDIQSQIELARQLPGEKMLISGNHATHFPAGMIRATGALAAVREEPEFTLLDALQQLRSGQSLATVNGLSWRDGSNISHNNARPVQPMQQLPEPAYDLVQLAHYHYELLGSHFALLETSRGCPYRCNFCNLSMFQNSYRWTEAAQVTAQIDKLVLQHGCRSLYIFDLEFTLNKAMVEAVCQHLIQQDYANKFGFRWCCQTRADSVNPELLQLMKKAGCSLIHFGVEAGNADILKATNKKISKDKIRSGLAAARQAGIRTAGFFIIGHPNETEQNYVETLDFALELNPTYASFHPFLSFPGSPLYVQRHGKGPYWDKDPDFTATYLTPDAEYKVKNFVRKAYLKFYLRPGYVKRLFSQGEWSLYRRQLQLFWQFLVQR